MVEVNRALFLAWTASMGAGAALSTGSCASSDTSAGDQADATGTDATSSDVAAETLEDSAMQPPADVAADAPGDVSIDTYPDQGADQAVVDSATDAGLDAPLDTGPDAPSAPDAPSDASDAASLPPLPDGGVNAACPAFTCELGQLNCRAAYSGGVIDPVALALYACAQTVCYTDSGAGTFVVGTTCAAAALEATPAQGSATSFCASQTNCSDAGNYLSVSACERYFSSLTPSALAAFQRSALHDAGLTCTDTGSLTFNVLNALANP
jgi:hypothetical protein